MKFKKFTLILTVLALVMSFLQAFSPLTNEPPIFSDDFERYRGDSDLQKAYQVWLDGARLNIALEKKAVGSGNQALRVETLAPHPQSGLTNGSFYHVLSLKTRNWSGATGIRFWIKNVSADNLLLSINFKERFNEYWAVSQNGVFLLENPLGQFQRREIEFGNLVIPPDYSGYVVVPFAFFSVPDWNTARGDEVMQLSAIESFAFGISLSGSFPHIFILDDISVIGQAEYPYLEIKGVNSIQLPVSGEHREPFSVYLNEPVKGSARMVSAEWQIEETPDDGITIDTDGWLSVPAGSTGGTVTLMAQYRGAQGVLIDRHTVIIAGEGQTEEEPLAQEPTEAPTAIQPQPSDYERFSQIFEAWASTNRPLFVLLSIAVVLVALAVLTSFQKKIK